MTSKLGMLGSTQQRLLRQLIGAPEGRSVEELCERLHISHNAVRQHLTSLRAQGYVESGTPRQTAGRPQHRYLLSADGRELFPRNYGIIANGILGHFMERLGPQELDQFLRGFATQLADSQPALQLDDREGALARAAAERLDSLGYEAIAARNDGEWQVEAFNCVFHELAKEHPQLCSFDLAFLERTTGHEIHHAECILHGGHVCRFRIGHELTKESS